MISAKTFFSDTLNTVDAVIGNYVNLVYTHFVQANAGVITLLFTLYIVFIGMRFLYHDQRVDMSTVTRQLIVMLSVYGLLMSWHLYHLFVYNIFTNEPAHIAEIMVSSAQRIHPDTTIAEVLDHIYEAVINATIGFFGQVSFSSGGIAFLFYGILVFVIGSLMCVFTLLLFIYAKMMMAVSLALGPLFLSFVLWEPTKNMFTAWLNKLITIALVPVITSAILVLMLSVIDVTLPHLNQPVENMQFYGIVPFLGLSLATTMILAQVLRIASALAGGITLASLSTGASIAKTAFEKSTSAVPTVVSSYQRAGQAFKKYVA
jgi:type IV secretion system protein VirB6